ncbi:hypothetical protein ACHAPE_001097 [Trichoderma viride]
MSNRGESVILPSNAVFLVHKVGGTKAGRGSQWETRTKSMRVAPDLAPRISVAVNGNNESKSNANTEGDALEFVAYTPGKRQQLTKRPREVKRGRRAKRSVTPPKDRSLVSVKKEPMLSRNPSPMPTELPVALVGHALLYINYSLSANALASLTGSPSNYVDSHSLLDEALRQLKSRVASGSLPTDQTLGAISCLAMWSNDQGNHDKAWIHAQGLAELVKVRGGFAKIDNRMRSKVYRGVFDIAVDVDQPPLLDEGLRDSPSREIISEDSLESESELASSECRIPPRLSSIFHDITQLNAVVDDAMTRNVKLDTDSLYESVFGIYNRLLSCQSDKMSDCDNSLRISLILYIKSLTSGGRFNATSTNLVRKLQASIQGCLHSSSPLMRWKLWIGSLAASDGTTEQQWFLQHSATAIAESGMASADGWTVFQEELSSILWAKPVLEAAGHNLWLRIMGANST